LQFLESRRPYTEEWGGKRVNQWLNTGKASFGLSGGQGRERECEKEDYDPQRRHVKPEDLFANRRERH
jgi:hypothetical protein